MYFIIKDKNFTNLTEQKTPRKLIFFEMLMQLQNTKETQAQVIKTACQHDGAHHC